MIGVILAATLHLCLVTLRSSVGDDLASIAVAVNGEVSIRPHLIDRWVILVLDDTTIVVRSVRSGSARSAARPVAARCGGG